MNSSWVSIMLTSGNEEGIITSDNEEQIITSDNEGHLGIESVTFR